MPAGNRSPAGTRAGASRSQRTVQRQSLSPQVLDRVRHPFIVSANLLRRGLAPKPGILDCARVQEVRDLRFPIDVTKQLLESSLRLPSKTKSDLGSKYFQL